MSGVVARALIDLIACLTLAVVIVDDMRRFRIRNAWIGILSALAIGALMMDGGGALVLSHGLFAGIVFVAMALAFAAGMIGAGDAKLLVVACLWVGPESALTFAFGLLVLTACYGACALRGVAPAQIVDGRVKIPFGPSIAGAWVSVIAFRTIGQVFLGPEGLLRS